MSSPKPPDELLQRYQEACALDERRPNPKVREAVRAHAAMLMGAAARHTPVGNRQHASATNQSRWKISLLASLALVGLTGLLVLQFERGTPEEQELALGRPKAQAPRQRLEPPQSSAPESAPTLAAETSSTGKAAQRPGANAPAQQSPSAKPSRTQAKADIANIAERATATRELPAAPTPAQADAAPPAAAVPATGGSIMPSPSMEAGVPPSLGVGALPSRRVATDQSVQSSAKALAPSAMMAPAPQLKKAEQQGQRQDKDSRKVTDLNRALLESARSGQVEQMEALLRQGAAINARDEAGRTALILATMHAHTAAVQRLLALGANPALRDHEGLSALQHAQQLGLKALANLLENAP